MSQFSQILVAIDLEDEAMAKTACESALALRGEGALHLVYVAPSFGMSLVGAYFPADYEADLMAKATASLHAFSEKVLP